jgi:hypothetical protein
VTIRATAAAVFTAAAALPSLPHIPPLPHGLQASGLRVAAQTAVDRQPGAPAFGFGSVWVPSSQSGILDRVDPHTTKVVARIRSARAVAVPQNEYFDSVAVSPTAVWHASDVGNEVVRIDPRTNRVVATIAVPGRPDAVAAGPQGVYVALFQQTIVLRIDPATNTIAEQRDVGGRAMGVAFGAGSVWALSTTGPSVVRLDPATLGVRGRTSIASTAPVGAGYFDAWWIAADAHGVCAGNQKQNVVTRLDAATGKRTGEVALGFGSNLFGVAADGKSCWGVNATGVFRTGDGPLRSSHLPSTAPSAFVGVAVGAGSAWVTAAGRNTLFRVSR